MISLIVLLSLSIMFVVFYTAKTSVQLREERGTLAEKIASELDRIDTAIDALGSGTGTLATNHIFVGSAGSVATDVAMSGDISIVAAGTTTIGAGKVTNAMHVAASEDGTVCKVVANDAVIGGIPVVHMVIIAAGANAVKNITLTHATRILDAHIILKSAGVSSETITVGYAGNAITNAMAASGADTTLVRAAIIDDANYEIAAGGVLRITPAGGASQPDALVVVTGVRIP